MVLSEIFFLVFVGLKLPNWWCEKISKVLIDLKKILKPFYPFIRECIAFMVISPHFKLFAVSENSYFPGDITEIFRNITWKSCAGKIRCLWEQIFKSLTFVLVIGHYTWTGVKIMCGLNRSSFFFLFSLVC